MNSAALARLNRAVLAGLEAAAQLLSREVRATLSVQAPLRTVYGKRGVVFRAATPAVQGQPPRRVTGNLQQKVTVFRLGNEQALRVTAQTPYAGFLERGRHPFLAPTVQRVKGRVLAEFARVVRGSLGG
jgi:hypothetical protein